MRSMLAMLLMMGAASAADREQAVNRVITHLTLAYQCEPVTGDQALYEEAKRLSAQTLLDIGEPSGLLDRIIAGVEGESRTDNPLTEGMCRNMLANFRVAE